MVVVADSKRPSESTNGLRNKTRALFAVKWSRVRTSWDNFFGIDGVSSNGLSAISTHLRNLFSWASTEIQTLVKVYQRLSQELWMLCVTPSFFLQLSRCSFQWWETVKCLTISLLFSTTAFISLWSIKSLAIRLKKCNEHRIPKTWGCASLIILCLPELSQKEEEKGDREIFKTYSKLDHWCWIVSYNGCNLLPFDFW